MRILVLALLVALPAAGCLDLLAPADVPPTVRGSVWQMELPLTIHVVAVGFDGRLDGEALLADLPVSRPVYNLAEEGATRAINLEPIQYRLDWRFHEASPAFATAFFAAAEAASFEGPAPAFLVEYDRASGEMRLPQGPLAETPLGATPAGSLGQTEEARMDYVDAPTLEQWLHDNRAEYGLDFPEPEYTVFLVDSYTNAYLPQDRYHYYYFDDGTIDADLERTKDATERLEGLNKFHTPKDPTSNRGWGGKWGAAWIDVGAAPSWLDDEPFVPPFEDDNVDHPVWDVADDPAKMTRNLRRHLEDFALVKVLRTPIYDFEWVDEWWVPVHVFVDSAAVSGAWNPVNGVDVETWLGVERMVQAFTDLAPWVKFNVTVEYHYLPMDDPGMAEAVRTAKLYGSPTIVSSGVIEDYVRTNWDAYAPPEEPGRRVVPQFFFYFEGLYTFWGPNQGGGYAAGDGWGRSWAAFDHVFDLCANPGERLQGSCLGTKADKWQGEGTMDMLVIHEGGHHLGLTHARDTAVLDEDLASDYRANWFWDSVWSVMTYRHQWPGFDAWDKDVVARGHAAWTLNLTAARLAELEATGASPDSAAAARAGIARTEQILREGRWQDAAREGIATWKALEAAAGGIATPPLETTVESFGGTVLAPVSPGTGGGFGPTPVPLAFPTPETPLNAFATEIEIQEGVAYVHLAMRDTRPQIGALRFAYLVLLDPAGEFAGFAGNDVFAESYVTRLPAGPGTYTAVLVTNGGLASEYEVTLDVHYPSA